MGPGSSTAALLLPSSEPHSGAMSNQAGTAGAGRAAKPSAKAAASAGRGTQASPQPKLGTSPGLAQPSDMISGVGSPGTSSGAGAHASRLGMPVAEPERDPLGGSGTLTGPSSGFSQRREEGLSQARPVSALDFDRLLEGSAHASAQPLVGSTQKAEGARTRQNDREAPEGGMASLPEARSSQRTERALDASNSASTFGASSGGRAIERSRGGVPVPGRREDPLGLVNSEEPLSDEMRRQPLRDEPPPL